MGWTVAVVGQLDQHQELHRVGEHRDAGAVLQQRHYPAEHFGRDRLLRSLPNDSPPKNSADERKASSGEDWTSVVFLCHFFLFISCLSM